MINLGKLLQNIKHSNNTSSTLFEAINKVLWMYGMYRFVKLRKFKSWNFTFVYPLPIGKIILNVRDNRGSDRFIISEVFENQYYNLYEFTVKNNIKTIIDLGANAGFTSVYFSRLYPNATIYALEPIENNYIQLKTNASLNSSLIIPLKYAIAPNDGQVYMIESSKDYAHKVSDIKFGASLFGTKTLVESISMLSLIGKFKIESIDILKIDIEGYEEILFSENNSWLRHVKLIVIEIHENVSIENIIKITRHYGLFNTTQMHGNWVIF